MTSVVSARYRGIIRMGRIYGDIKIVKREPSS